MTVRRTTPRRATPRHVTLRRTTALAGGLAGLAAPLLLAGPAASAPADADVTVVDASGAATAAAEGATRLTVTGRGFQSVRGGFGGVYVMFGWVDDPDGGSWKPSRGGLTGRDYRYVPDAESAADNRGHLAFVAFPGSSTAGEAQATLTADGSFTVPLSVPGARFTAVDREGGSVVVDCRQVTCGVITIGAHGVKNARNETFTPVRFTAPAAEEDQQADGADPGRESAPARSTDGETAGTPPTGTRRAVGRPRLVVDTRTAVAGHALAFTGRGFRPGEQVVAVLDDGAAALGPLVAGADGEVAAVLALPADLPAGTHELRLTGAASGRKPVQRFPVTVGEGGDADAGTAADDVVAAAEPAPATTERSPDRAGRPGAGAYAFLAVAAVLLLAALALLAVRLARSRRAASAAAALVLLGAGALVTWSDAPVARAAPLAGTAYTLDDAQLRWGVNDESNNRAFAPGTFNFLSAGLAPDPGAGGQTLDARGRWPGTGERAWRARAGDVRVEKRQRGGGWALAEYAGLQTTPAGDPIPSPTSGEFSGHEVVLEGGTGVVDPDAGTARISWSGSFSVFYYSGMTLFGVSDPRLEVTPDSARLVGTLSGWATSMEDRTAWGAVAPREVTLADLPRSALDLAAERGVRVRPAYRGVAYDPPAEGVAQLRSGSSWGAFPASFVDFLGEVGSAAYWYSSGGSADAAKVAAPVTLSWAASDPLTGGTGGDRGAEEPEPTEETAQETGTSEPTALPRPTSSPVPPDAPAVTETVTETAEAPPPLPQPPAATAVLAAAAPSGVPTAASSASPAPRPDSPWPSWPWWAGSLLLLAAAATTLASTRLRGNP